MENLCFYECHELILCITLSFSQYVVISDCPCLSLWDLVVRFTDRHDLLLPKEVRSCLFVYLRTFFRSCGTSLVNFPLQQEGNASLPKKKKKKGVSLRFYLMLI